MAGILNQKQRVIDAIFTVDGRRQIANGTIDIAFATFTDNGVFYESDDGVTARNPADTGITLEAVSLPRDVIIPEADDDGAFSLSLTDNSKIVNGRRVVSGSFEPMSGTLSSYSGSLSVMSTAVNHFSQLGIIGTTDGLTTGNFNVDLNNVELTTNLDLVGHINKLKPILFDDDLNHMMNVRFLPPEYEENNVTLPMGNYSKITNENHSTFDTFEEEELKNSISSETIVFSETSNSNNLLGQVFEIGPDGVTKLAIIDYGEFSEDGEIQGRVFYLGKVARDLSGTPKFLRLFTLVFK